MADAINDEDFSGPDGKINHSAANKARITNGETCQKCGGYVTCLPSGTLTLCYSCRQLADDPGEVTHDAFIRCPKCGHEEDTSQLDSDSGYIFEAGETDWACSECGHVFTVSTDVSYSFTSPEMLAKAEK
jgi:uncharacterized C2H2 Zn-finger protein